MLIQQAGISPDLAGQVIPLWTVVYHNDPDCTYPFFEWRSVLNGVEGSLRTFIDVEGIKTEAIIRQLMKSLHGFSHRPMIPISLNLGGSVFTILIYRWEIDYSTPLFRILSKCYEQVDIDTKVDIMGLLSNSVR